MEKTIPTGWEEKTLGEICEFRNGLWTGKKEPFIECNVIRNANFSKDFKLNYDNVVRIIVEEKQFHPRELKYGDLILEKSGGGPNQPVGRVVIFDKHENGYSFSNFTSLIRIKNKELINFRFLYLYLCYCYLSGMTIKMQKNSTGIRNLIFDEYKNIRAPIPNIKEQERIVAKLDKAFEAIDKVKANAEQNLNNAKELFDGYLENIVAPKDKLGKYIKITTGKLNSNAAVENGQYPFFTCSRTPLRINNFAFDCEAILLAGNNASGDFNVKHYKGKFNAYQRTYVITIPDKSKLNYRYLYFQLFKALAELKKMSLGANTKFLRVGMITDFMLSMPTIEEQQKIVEKLDALQEQTKQLEAIYTQKIKECDELKQSILQKAFRGEL